MSELVFILCLLFCSELAGHVRHPRGLGLAHVSGSRGEWWAVGLLLSLCEQRGLDTQVLSSGRSKEAEATRGEGTYPRMHSSQRQSCWLLKFSACRLLEFQNQVRGRLPLLPVWGLNVVFLHLCPRPIWPPWWCWAQPIRSLYSQATPFCPPGALA